MRFREFLVEYSREKTAAALGDKLMLADLNYVYANNLDKKYTAEKYYKDNLVHKQEYISILYYMR